MKSTPNTTFEIFRRAILEKKQVTCTYSGCYRELCPQIIGYTGGTESVLAFQTSGESMSGVPAAWRCFKLDRVQDARMRDDPWHEGRRFKAVQCCVQEIVASRTVGVSWQVVVEIESLQRELIGVLHRLSEAIETNNAYRMRDSADQSRRHTEIRTAINLLRTPGAFTVAAVTVLLSTLTYLAIKFADSVIGALAEFAVAYLERLLGG